MNEKKSKAKLPPPPQMSPYVFTLLLLGFGLWCFWDGWLNTDPEMAEYALFNQVVSAVLIPWAIWDFFNVKRKYKRNNSRPADPRGSEPTEKSDFS